MTVVRKGEPMLGRSSGRLAKSAFWFVTSSLVFLFNFQKRRFKRLVARGDVGERNGIGTLNLRYPRCTVGSF